MELRAERLAAVLTLKTTLVTGLKHIKESPVIKTDVKTNDLPYRG